MRGGGRTTAGLNASSSRLKPSKPDRAVDQVIRTNAMARYRTLAAGLEKAAIAKSWQGSQPPADWAQINKDLHDARGKLQAFVQSLLPKEPEA